MEKCVLTEPPGPVWGAPRLCEDLASGHLGGAGLLFEGYCHFWQSFELYQILEALGKIVSQGHDYRIRLHFQAVTPTPGKWSRLEYRARL